MCFIYKLHFNGHELDVVEFSIEDIEQYTDFTGKLISMPSGSKVRITVEVHPDSILFSAGQIKVAEVTLYQHDAISRIKGFSFRNAYSRVYSITSISPDRKAPVHITINFFTTELIISNAWGSGQWVLLN